MEKHKLARLAIQVVVYYLITLGGLFALIYSYPEARDYLPVGGIDRLGMEQNLIPLTESGALDTRAVEDRALRLLMSLVGTLVFMVPVSWVYARTRSGKQSGAMLETIFLLPIVVTSVIVIVQNSLVLAFSLFGVVGAVRFRNSLKSPSDAVFVFASLSVGLAAGVAEIGVAGVASMVFSLTVIGLRYLGVVDAAPKAKISETISRS